MPPDEGEVRSRLQGVVPAPQEKSKVNWPAAQYNCNAIAFIPSNYERGRNSRLIELGYKEVPQLSRKAKPAGKK